MPDKEGLRAQRRSAGCNSNGAARVRSRVPTMVSAKSWSAQHRLREITSREITHRDDAGLVGGRPRRGAGTDHSAAAAMARPGPIAGGADRHAADRADPPYGARERDSLCQSPATGSDLSRSQFVSGRRGRIFSARKRPLPSQPMGTWQKFVITGCVTICNTSRNTRGRRRPARADDHATCCIWSALQASSTSSRSAGSGSTLTAPRNVRTKSEPPRKPLYDSQGAFTGGLP
jgi:hypothetical protein